MAKIEVPFVGEDINTSSPSSAVMTIVMLVIGFGVFAMAQGIGGYLGSKANSTLGQFLGFNPATGESQGVEVL